jgi:two-component system response regulator DegU
MTIPIFRRGMANALAFDPRMNVIGQAAHGEKGLEMILALRPNIAMVDINLPGMNGQQITREVTKEHIATRIIVITAYDDGEQMLHAAIAGAVRLLHQGYPTRPARTDLIMRVLEGNYVMGEEVMSPKELRALAGAQAGAPARLQSTLRTASPALPFQPLSDREMDVLTRVVEGRSNKEIAVLLGHQQPNSKEPHYIHPTQICRRRPHPGRSVRHQARMGHSG